MISRRDFYIAIAALVIAIVSGMTIHAVISSKRADAARLDQVTSDMKPIHDQAAIDKQTAQKQTADAQAKEDTNQKSLEVLLAAILAQKNQQPMTTVDYQRIDQMISQHLGGLQVRTQVQTDAQGNVLPDAPSQVVISGPNASKTLRDYQLDCDAKGAQLNSCYGTVKNKSDELAAANTAYAAEVKDHEATKKELEVAKKGGTKWQRFRAGIKHSICGGAGVGAGTTVSRKNGPWTGVAIGAGAFVGCEFLTNSKF